MCNNCERIWKRHTIELDEKIRDFRQKFADFKSHRLNTLQTLKEICTELTGHRRNVNIATVAGCSTSIVGGIMAGVGLIATPFTLGASNVLTIAGLAIGAAGSATTIGSKVTETAIEYKRKKQLEELLTVDATTGAVVNESFEGIRFKCECLTELMPSACKTWMESDWEPILNNMLDFELLTVATVDILKRIMTLKTTSANESTDSDEMLKIMGIESKGALKGSKKGFILGLGISAIAIIGDTVVMGYAIHQLRNGSESECVKKLRQIVEQLETCLDEFESGCSHLLKDELKTIE